MSEEYRVKEVRIALKSGVLLIAEVDSLSSVQKLVADISSLGFDISFDLKEERNREKPPDGGEPPNDDPIARIATRAGLEQGILSKSKMIAFKDNTPQLLRPNAIKNTTDAVLVLLFAIETGLRKNKIACDVFKGLYEAQNIKSGSPLRIILANLRNQGYLDKSCYSSDKTLRLTAKGEEKAIEVVKEQCK